MRSRRQVSSGPVRAVVVAGAVALPLLTLRLRDPHVAGAWGTCPVLAVTGGSCPGCGALRALHDLAAGDVAAALSSNALLVLVGLPLLLAAALTWVRGRDQLTYPLWGYAVGLAALTGFTILRNLPVGSALAP